MTKLYTDAALLQGEAERDELDILPFVRRLLRPILEWPANDGLVVGLYSPWGYGKTTVLNFLDGELSKANPSGRRAIVVRFNPWLYGTPEAMLASFFGTAASAVTRVPWFHDEKKRLSTLADALRGVGTLVPIAAASVAMPAAAPFVGLAVSGLAKQLAKRGEAGIRDQQEQAKKILRELGDKKARLVVLIDDVDRAERAEILALLKLVKLVGDLPNTTYVLAMDDARVRQLLDTMYVGESGAAYLQKIVQTPVHLPLISAERLTELVKSALEEVAVEAGVPAGTLFPNQWRITDIFSTTIGSRVKTLRDRAILANAFRFFLVSSDELRDVNPEDALLIVFLETFYPDVYERVRQNKSYLTAEDERMRHVLGGDDVERSRRRRDATWYRLLTGETPPETILSTQDGVSRALADDPVLSPAHAALRRLFPSAITGYALGDVQQREYRTEHRICSFEEFDRYFQLRPPAGEVPDSVVNALMEAIVRRIEAKDWTDRRAEVRAMFNVLSRYDTEEYRKSFVRKMADRLEQVPGTALPGFVSVILDVSESLPTAGLLHLLNFAAAIVYRHAFSAARDARGHDRGAEAVEPVAVEIVRRLPDPIDAAVFGQDMVISREEWNLPTSSRAVVAREVLARFVEYLERGGNPFKAPSLPFVSLLNLWMTAEALVDDDGALRRRLIAHFLREDLEWVGFYLRVYATHESSGRIVFEPREPRATILAYHDKVLGLDTIRELVQAFRDRGLDDPHEVAEQAAVYFTQPDAVEPPGQGNPADSQ
jgi:predicted KAP-like P-loop ATPase